MTDDPRLRSKRIEAEPALDLSESTGELIDRARLGDQSATEKLFARHLRPLQRWASGRLPHWARDVADTDDLVQDVLLQTFKRMDAFESRGVGALQAYLRQAVVNRLRDELRRKGRRPDQTDLDDKEFEADDSPLRRAIGQQALDHYEEALRRLKPEEREIIIARLELEYTYEEIARVLGKPSEDAARKAAQRALVKLAEDMKHVRGERTD
jgi:RNA polymerase sigma-70 factor (ECF subfamily)